MMVRRYHDLATIILALADRRLLMTRGLSAWLSLKARFTVVGHRAGGR